MVDDDMEDIRRRMDMTERNQSDLARTITGLVDDVHEMRKPLDDLKTDREVRKERDKNLNERLDRIEKSIENLYSLGKWVLYAIGAAFITVAVTFIVNGGLRVGH